MTYTMAATEEIRRPGSLISRFLRAEFPVLVDLAADFEYGIRDAKPLAPEDPGTDYPWSLVGTAIDYRLRFLFEVVPVTRLPAFKSAQGFHVGDAGTARPWPWSTPSLALATRIPCVCSRPAPP